MLGSMPRISRGGLGREIKLMNIYSTHVAEMPHYKVLLVVGASDKRRTPPWLDLQGALLDFAASPLSYVMRNIYGQGTPRATKGMRGVGKWRVEPQAR